MGLFSQLGSGASVVRDQLDTTAMFVLVLWASEQPHDEDVSIPTNIYHFQTSQAIINQF